MLLFNKNNDLFEAMCYNDFTMINEDQFCLMSKTTTFYCTGVTITVKASLGLLLYYSQLQIHGVELIFHSKSETCIMYTFIPHRLIYFKCLFILIVMIITDN